MFSRFRWPFKQKVRSVYGRPDLGEEKTFEQQHTAESSGGQPHVIVLPFLHLPGCVQIPAALGDHDVFSRYEFFEIGHSEAEKLDGLACIKMLLRDGYSVVFVSWPDHAKTAFAFSPGTRDREITAHDLRVGYAIARDLLEGYSRRIAVIGGAH